MIESFRSRPLKRYWTRADDSGIRPDWRSKVRLVLSALDAATKPDDLDLPDLGFHALTGNLAGRYAVSVSRNWRITLRWVDDGATDIDLEDYHGR